MRVPASRGEQVTCKEKMIGRGTRARARRIEKLRAKRIAEAPVISTTMDERRFGMGSRKHEVAEIHDHFGEGTVCVRTVWTYEAWGGEHLVTVLQEILKHEPSVEDAADDGKTVVVELAEPQRWFDDCSCQAPWITTFLDATDVGGSTEFDLWCAADSAEIRITASRYEPSHKARFCPRCPQDDILRCEWNGPT